MDFLQKKCLAAGHDCKKKVPKAYQRLKLGPKMLEEALQKLKVAQDVLSKAQLNEIELKTLKVEAL